MLENLEIGGISGIGGGDHSCGVEIMALRAKIIVVLRTEIIVSADSGDSGDSTDSADSGDSPDSSDSSDSSDSGDSGDSTDSTDSGWWDSFCFFSWVAVCQGAPVLRCTGQR